jgi:tetratricopeptide (TPR) repeat protein
MNGKCSRAAAIVLLSLLTLHAQQTPAQNRAIPSVAAVPATVAPVPAPAIPLGAPPTGHSTIVVHVLGESGVPLGQQAVVQLWSPDATPVYAVTQPPADARFDGLWGRRYRVTASAAGYQAAENTLQTFSNDTFYQDIITLKRTPAPRPAQPADGPLSAAKKEAEQGLLAYRAGDFRRARAQFDKAFKLAPQDAQLNFLLGLSLLKSNDVQSAQSFLQRASALDPQCVPILVALGRARVEGGDYEGATTPLQQAASLDPKQWGAHWLLGSVYLVQREFANAAQEAQKAIGLGKGAANGAQLVLGEALAALGQRDQAQQALSSFLRDEPESPAAPVARQLINTLETHALIENQDVNRNVRVEAAQASAKSIPLVADVNPDDQATTWRPPAVDQVKPVLADGITCPTTTVLDRAMQRVGELADNVNRFAATEDILHQDLNASGKVLRTEHRKFDYVVSIEQLPSGDLDIDESRNGSNDFQNFPADIATLGLPSLAFVFHKQYRHDFNFNCEGLGEFHGRATWIVYFEQRPDRPSRIRGYSVEGTLHPVALQGRAWIAADSFQVVQMRSDLVKPMPEIKLRDEDQVIEYRPVLFEKSNTEMWLPATAELYFDFRNHKYHRVHTFSSYLLFSVTASEKIGSPKQWKSKKKKEKEVAAE